MKRRLTAMVLALLFAACAKAEEAAPQLSLRWWGDEAINQATQKAVEGFEKEKKTTVETGHATDRIGYVEQLKESLDAGRLPDVVQLDSEMLRLTAHAEDGSFRYASLEDYLDTLDLTQFSYLALAGGTIDSRLCAVPASMTSHVLVWNESAFVRLNLSVPETTEELLTVGRQLEGTVVYPLAADATGRIALVITYLQSHYGRSWVDNDTRTCGYTIEQVAEGLRYLKKLEDNHVLPPLSEQGDIQAGWQVGAYWGVWTWDSEAILLSTLPSGDIRKYTARLTDWAPYDGGFQKAQYLFAISEDSTNKTQAAGLIEYLLSSEAGNKILGDVRGAPISLSGNKYANKFDKINPALAEASTVALSWARWNMPLGFEAPQLVDGGGIYEQVLVGMESGLLTTDAAATALISGVKVVLMEY